MKKTFLATIPFFFILTTFNSCALFKPEMKVVGEVPLKTVFSKVLSQYQDALKTINHLSIGKHTVKVTEADVIFDNVITDEQSASLDILVFKTGYTRVKRKETTVTYSLIAITEEKKSHYLIPNTAKHPNALRDLIVNSYQQFIDVSVPPESGKFEKDIEIDVAFTVDQSGNVELSGPIGKFGPDLNLSRDVANCHTISIKFAIDKK